MCSGTFQSQGTHIFHTFIQQLYTEVIHNEGSFLPGSLPEEVLLLPSLPLPPADWSASASHNLRRFSLQYNHKPASCSSSFFFYLSSPPLFFQLQAQELHSDAGKCSAKFTSVPQKPSGHFVHIRRTDTRLPDRARISQCSPAVITETGLSEPSHSQIPSSYQAGSSASACFLKTSTTNRQLLQYKEPSQEFHNTPQFQASYNPRN